MPTEIEIKFKIDDLNVVRANLRAAKATLRGERFELNAFYDTADRTLKAQGRGLRLRTMRDADGVATHVITLKGPASGEAVKTREEIEFSVGSADDAALLLDRLGYRPTLGFEKRRETWELDDCLVELDTLPILGTFVEIEGEDEVKINAVRSTLGLQGESPVPRGYISMIDELVRSNPSLGPTVQF